MHQAVKPGPKGDQIKAYTTIDNLKRALRAAGILEVPHRVEQIRRHGRPHHKPVFEVDVVEDVLELRERGFAAELVKKRQEAAE